MSQHRAAAPNAAYTVFAHALARSRWSTLGWSLPLFLLGAITTPFYDLVAENERQLLAIVQTLPKTLTSFIGGDDAARFVTPAGFLELRYFAFLPIPLGVYGAVVGSGLLAADEERGVLDFLLAHPASRGAVFAGRLAALAAGAAVLMVAGWLGVWLGVGISRELDFSPATLFLPFVSAFAYTMLLAALGLALSMSFPARSAAAMIAGIVVLAGYLFTTLARSIEPLQAVAVFSPVSYFQNDAMGGLDPVKLAALAAPAALLCAAAWLAFRARDIRVAGEAGWKLPFGLGR